MNGQKADRLLVKLAINCLTLEAIIAAAKTEHRSQPKSGLDNVLL